MSGEDLAGADPVVAFVRAALLNAFPKLQSKLDKALGSEDIVYVATQFIIFLLVLRILSVVGLVRAGDGCFI